MKIGRIAPEFQNNLGWPHFEVLDDSGMRFLVRHGDREEYILGALIEYRVVGEPEIYRAYFTGKDESFRLVRYIARIVE